MLPANATRHRKGRASGQKLFKVTLSQPLQAGLYNTDEPYRGPRLGDNGATALGFSQFRDLLTTNLGIAVTLQESPARKHYLEKSAELERKARTGALSTQEQVNLSEYLIRLGKVEEAVQLLRADPCPSAVTTLILDPTQTALQVHESCGHPIELDRVFGTEAAYAGTSFLTPDKLGSFRYGSEAVTIVADATVPTGLGTFGFDDEGVPAQRTVIVDRGRFANYLTSRETAAVLGRPSNGTMRASGWNRIPLIRMTNVNLEPGDYTLEQLIAETDDGIFMHTNKSWSIDDKRLNFQFGVEIAWEVKRGRLGRLLKDATYTGVTPQFWGSCDGVAGEWNVWGTPNCGKGQPGQVAHVGHGAAATRFRNVQVGMMR